MPLFRKLYTDKSFIKKINSIYGIVNNKGGNKLLKRQKLAPFEIETPEPTFCQLFESNQIFDTGFEDGCNYLNSFFPVVDLFPVGETYEDDIIGGDFFAPQ